MVNLTESEIYDYFQSLLPNTIQFVEADLDTFSLPNGDYAAMHILYINDVGRSISGEESHNEVEKTVNIGYYQQRIFKMQFDFYGSNSFDNARKYKQILQIKIDDENHTKKNNLGIKVISEIRNLTEFLEDKKYFRRYSFDIEFFMVDSQEIVDIYLEKFQNTIINV